MKRRLAQNREAARKSRQRRKAYVQNLEEEVSTSCPPEPSRHRFIGFLRRKHYLKLERMILYAGSMLAKAEALSYSSSHNHCTGARTEGHQVSRAANGLWELFLPGHGQLWGCPNHARPQRRH